MNAFDIYTQKTQEEESQQSVNQKQVSWFKKAEES